jgi:hypothetical protein
MLIFQKSQRAFYLGEIDFHMSIFPLNKSLPGRTPAFVILLLLGCFISCQKTPPPREYSADFTMTDSTFRVDSPWSDPAAYRVRAKIHVTPEKVRIDFERSKPTKVLVTYPGTGEREEEIPALFRGPYWGSDKHILMNYSDQSGWVFSPTDGTYSRFLDEPDVVERLLLTKVLLSLQPAARPSNETSHCPENAEFPCKRIGVEELNGREAVKWETRIVRRNRYMAESVPQYLWTDQDLGILLKSSASGSSLGFSEQELTNLNQSTQDASWFQSPVGYNKK